MEYDPLAHPMRYLLISMLLLASGGCSTPENTSQTQPSAAARAAIRQLIQRQTSKDVAYAADLGWKETSSLHQSAAGYLPVQKLLASWAANMQRANGFDDTIFSLRPDTMARRLYGPNWQRVVFEAAKAADDAKHRADRQAARISQLLDSINARPPTGQPADADDSGCRYWLHTFQLKSPTGEAKRDSLEFIVWPSQQVQLLFPLKERFWVPETRPADPF